MTRDEAMSVDKLAEIIRTVDGDHTAGAGALADGIADSGFLVGIYAAGQDSRQEEIDKVKALIVDMATVGKEAINLGQGIATQRDAAEAEVLLLRGILKQHKIGF